MLGIIERKIIGVLNVMYMCSIKSQSYTISNVYWSVDVPGRYLKNFARYAIWSVSHNVYMLYRKTLTIKTIVIGQ